MDNIYVAKAVKIEYFGNMTGGNKYKPQIIKKKSQKNQNFIVEIHNEHNLPVNIRFVANVVGNCQPQLFSINLT